MDATRTLFAALWVCAVTAAGSAAEPQQLILARQAQDILKANCYRCHGQNGTNEGGFNYVLNLHQLVNRKKVIPGRAAKSKLYKRLTSEDNPMPPEEEKPRPSKEDVAVVKQWIEAGAADVGPAAVKQKYISPAEIVRAIRADLEKVAERDRRFTRYFTITHLYNAGLSADQLQSHRHGLSKLVNSLSWGRKISVPRPVDAEQTIFRIDLRDYQWNEAVWEAIVGRNPYGVTVTDDSARHCSEATQCKLPYARGDWFVAAASRPPLYHEVLQLPRTDKELEQMLRVDVAENIRQERVARAGFNSSGVSRNNRLIERHESGNVVYWKSYDFASNTGRQNLFAHALGPGDDNNHFQHDGGEVIFTLPNRLQGYMLVDGKGRRIDKGPTAIVSDPKRPDRAVENGISCMSCHAKGIIEKSDQIRGHVLKNPQAFTDSEMETVKALYPPKSKFDGLLKEDAKRFQDAVARTGAPLTATEPIVALTLRFEGELDLPLAAAEAGATPEVLLKALERSPHLAKQLGSLKLEGGTIQRQVFVDAFPDIIRALKLGEFLEPRNTIYVKLIGQGDAAAKEGDAAGALKAYSEAVDLEPENPVAFIARGDAYREKSEHDRAIADYDAALRLDPRSAVTFNNRGLAYHRKRAYERALGDFTEALRLDPRFAVAYHNRAAAHFSKGSHDDAIADYAEALRLDPKSAVAYNNRGLAHHEKGDYDRAIADFEQAIRLQPKLAVAFNNRGLAHFRKEKYDRAIADFTEAIRLDPKFARAFYNRSIAHEKQGDRARAETDRKRALELDPTLDKE